MSKSKNHVLSSYNAADLGEWCSKGSLYWRFVRVTGTNVNNLKLNRKLREAQFSQRLPFTGSVAFLSSSATRRGAVCSEGAPCWVGSPARSGVAVAYLDIGRRSPGRLVPRSIAGPLAHGAGHLHGAVEGGRGPSRGVWPRVGAGGDRRGIQSARGAE